VIVEKFIHQHIHFQNCIPFPIESSGSNRGQIKHGESVDGLPYKLYDVINDPGVQGDDFDWFCPIRLFPILGDFHPGLVLNPSSLFKEFDFRTHLRRCANVNVNSSCASTRTLEQTNSPKLDPSKSKILMIIIYLVV
jgi:hypothetical protein